MANDGQSWWNQMWQQGMSQGTESPDAPTLPNDIDRRKIDFLQGRIPSTGEALGVGCGSARLLCRVGGQWSGVRLVALDNADAALAQARATASTFGVTIDTVNGNALDLPFENNRFDAVLSGGLLEHFTDPRLVLAEMVRVLKPGGTLYADVVPRKLSWYRRAEAKRMLRSPWLAPGVFESSYLAPEYVRWLEELSCTRIETKWCGVYPHAINKLPTSIRRAVSNGLGALDGTLLADAAGWYFMLSASKVG
ncbi:MAG: methyltransferase domain-containing protein [Polyangiaceae bacterium]